MKCHSLHWVYFVLGLVSIIAFARPSLAVPTVFFDRDNTTNFMTSYPNSQAEFNQFTASLSSFGVATIDNAVGPNPTLTFDGSTITAASGGVIAVPAAGFQIGTQALLELDAAGPGQFDTSFTFNQYITGFGLYVIQGGDSQNNNPTTFRFSDTATNVFFDVPIQIGPGWGNDNAFFLGVGSTVPFNQVTIIESIDTGDGMLYDNLVAGTAAVPEPSAMTLLAVGSLGICWYCIGRRNSKTGR
ncbi:MAG TPA: PEP-CTERM sorting domain-containing protein [Pirellulales bacterium]